ncbi:hypothetical protein MPER_15375, partial [Moniliophthora perniciosa FA553]
KEIEDKIGPIPEPVGTEPNPDEEDEVEETEMSLGEEDTSDVPLQHVINEALSVNVEILERNTFTVDIHQVETVEGVTRGAGNELYEDIRMYREGGGGWSISDFILDDSVEK